MVEHLLRANAMTKMTQIAARKDSSTLLTHAHLQFHSAQRQHLPSTALRQAGDGGAPSECDDKFHPDTSPVVALSTGWYSRGKRCLDYITIYGNGNSVKAMVVDECDSTMGCDSDHDFQPPCPNNIVDASKAVWKALGVDEGDWGELDIYWSDA
ncbi:unnamed protein product [Rhodiola kirilowii]